MSLACSRLQVEHKQLVRAARLSNGRVRRILLKSHDALEEHVRDEQRGVLFSRQDVSRADASLLSRAARVRHARGAGLRELVDVDRRCGHSATAHSRLHVRSIQGEFRLA